MKPSSRYTIAGLGLAMLRIYAGAFWLSYGIPKFVHGDQFMPPSGYMADFLQKAIQNSSGVTHDVLLHVVLPNAATFANLSRFGEVLVGCSLLFGMFTRLGGLGGVLLAASYLPANAAFHQYGVPMLHMIDALALALSAVHVLVPTGKVLGVDGLFTGRASDPVVGSEPLVAAPPPRARSAVASR